MSALIFRCFLIGALLILSSVVQAMPSSPRQDTSALGKPIRALHFVLMPGMKLSSAKWLVNRASEASFNTIVVQLAGGVRMRSLPKKSDEQAWTKKEFKEWLDYTKQKGIVVIPELKLLTHQNKLFEKRYPNLMYNHDTYDPRNKGVYEIVFPLLDEIIVLMAPPAIHIGHDESIGWKFKTKLGYIRPAKLRHGESALPAALFLNSVRTLKGYLDSKGIQTWMWGDMLMAPEEFPGMLAGHLHGTIDGYGKSLRDQIPKSVVIIDWHYSDKQKDFDSTAKLVSEGFSVIGSTWTRDDTTNNFSAFAARSGAMGMLATTWFYVPKKEWDVVERVISVSGKAFGKEFPDDK